MHRTLRNGNYWFKNRRSFRVFCLFLLVSIFWANTSSTSLLYAQEPQDGESTPRVFLPYVSNFSADATFREPPIALTAEETAVEALLRSTPGQQHPVLVLNASLTNEARRKAEDMANRGFFGHTDPDGFGPNHWVMAAGYTLPAYYDNSPGGNNVESIAAGQTTAQEAWNAWMNSNGHRSHLLGEIDFYREQIDYGIGYFHSDSSLYRNYWVVLIAKPG